MHFKMSSACFNLEQSKILSSGNGLKAYKVQSRDFTEPSMIDNSYLFGKRVRNTFSLNIF